MNGLIQGTQSCLLISYHLPAIDEAFSWLVTRIKKADYFQKVHTKQDKSKILKSFKINNQTKIF